MGWISGEKGQQTEGKLGGKHEDEDVPGVSVKQQGIKCCQHRGRGKVLWYRRKSKCYVHVRCYRLFKGLGLLK